MALTSTLAYFSRSEFRHPELVDDGCAVRLDTVRALLGKPLILTSDARTPEENAAIADSSPTSLHLLGRAFDLRWLDSAKDRYYFEKAVYRVSIECEAELEWVLSGSQKHIHLGWFLPGHPGSLELRVS